MWALKAAGDSVSEGYQDLTPFLFMASILYAKLGTQQEG